MTTYVGFSTAVVGTVLGLMRITREDHCLFLLDEPDTHLNPLWNQNTVCKPTTPKWRHTVERLKTKLLNWDAQ